MSSTEVDFLRDQVERLNALLAKYQEQYSLPIQEEEVDRAQRPWMTNRELVSPLMQEYDVILHQLQREADDYKNQVLDFRQQLEELVSENERLRQDLKDVVSQQLEGGGSVPGTSANIPSTSSAPSVANLQHQLRLALQEKEACQERWREATQELDRVEAEMQALKDSHQWRSVEKQAHDIQDQYAQSVTILNTELETLQSDLRQVRQELAESQRQVLELKKTNYTLQQQLSMRDEERAETIFKEGIADSRMAEIQRIMEDLRQRVASANREAEESKREKSLLEARLAELNRRLADTEHRENEAIQQVRDAITMAETSVLEKDQAEIQLRHKEEEIAQLQDSLAKIINEAGLRTRQEVDNVRKQSNDRVTKLTEELHALELDNTEKQAQIERLLREKRAVESELQKIHCEGKLDGTRTKGMVEELSRRLSEAERARDDLLMRIETVTQALEKERDENQQMKESYEVKLQTLQERLSTLQQEYDNTSDDRLHHMDTINTLTKKLQQAEQEKDGFHRKFLKELALIEQDQQTKTRGFEVQLQSTEDARRTSIAELRKLLGAQQRMSARWKEECQTITHKFEGKMEELRAEITHLRRRNEQLTSLLKESQEKTAEAERVMSEYTRNIRRMEARVYKAESQATDSAKQLSRHHMKERQLSSERQSLINELSRSQRDKYLQTTEGFTSGCKDGGQALPLTDFRRECLSLGAGEDQGHFSSVALQKTKEHFSTVRIPERRGHVPSVGLSRPRKHLSTVGLTGERGYFSRVGLSREGESFSGVGLPEKRDFFSSVGLSEKRECFSSVGLPKENKLVSDVALPKENDCFLCGGLPKEKEDFLNIEFPREKEHFSSLPVSGTCEEKESFPSVGHPNDSSCVLCEGIPKEKEDFVSVKCPKERECFSSLDAAGASEERKHLSSAGFHKEMECFLCRELPREKEHFMSVGGPKECFLGVDAKESWGEKEHFSNVGHPNKSEHFLNVGHPNKNELSSSEPPKETDSLGSIGFTAEGEQFVNMDAQGGFDESGDLSTYSSVAIQTERDHFSNIELTKKSRRFSSAGPSREKEHFALAGLPKERSKQFSPVDMERSSSKKCSSSVKHPDRKERSTSSYSLQSCSGSRPKPALLDFYCKEWESEWPPHRPLQQKRSSP